jgi:tripartite-type tricarboxylate transporter receptor subunit TctC
MMLTRRNVLQLSAGTVAAQLAVQPGWAQSYPSKPVRVIVGYAAGGGTDIFVRLIGQQLTERLGQSFVIENRPGASTNLATETVARSSADGYTLLATDTAAAVNATTYDKLSFNFVRDFVVVGMIRGPLVMVVHPSVPAKTVPEFITNAKSNPGKVSMGSAGTGGSGHVGGELFQMVSGVKMIHVPYRGAGPAVADLLGGQVQVVFPGPPSVVEHVRAGRLRALAVTTTTRLEALPDVPTMAETLPGFEAIQWYAVSLRGNTPANIVEKLSKEINSTISDDKIAGRIVDLGMTGFPASAAVLTQFVANETEKWAKVIRAANIKAE